MAKKKRDEKTPLSLPELTVHRKKAEDMLEERISKGNDLLNIKIQTTKELQDLRNTYSKWSSYNGELLLRIFSNSIYADEYNSPLHMIFSMRERSLYEQEEETKDDIKRLIVRLEEIRDRLGLIPEPQTDDKQDQIRIDTTMSNQVFIVHGHDDGAKEGVARFISQLNLQPVILHEQANQGKTIIEKFENYGNVGFAVILLTPDDIIYDDKGIQTEKRARQNVIFELGYFFGKLGRARTCALYKAGVALPSDFSGIVYVNMDDAGGWKLILARELKQVGFSIDLNSLV